MTANRLKALGTYAAWAGGSALCYAVVGGGGEATWAREMAQGAVMWASGFCFLAIVIIEASWRR